MFLLVPAHPGCPRQNPESRKMVVCVCMCVCDVIRLAARINLIIVCLMAMSVRGHKGHNVPSLRSHVVVVERMIDSPSYLE